MNVYLNRKTNAIAFRINLRIVDSGKGFELVPKIVAEPGDLIIVKGNLLTNLSRAAARDPRVVHSVDSLKFLKAKAS